jgi:outer membrane protein OmpA-like peptidoglycan-associated protein
MLRLSARRGAVRTLAGALTACGMLAALPAAAQQAYFRGQAEPDESVIVNLSVIEELQQNATGSLAPTGPVTLPPAAPSQAPQPAPAPPPTGGQSAGSGLAPPPASAPRSTLLVPGGENAAAPQPAPTPAPRPSPSPAPAPSTPPPAPEIPETAAAPQPAPAPRPAPSPSPAPASPPQSELESEPSAEPPPPAPDLSEEAESAAAPAPAPPPPPPPETEPEPAPEPAAQPEAPPAEAETETAADADAESDQVASVDLRDVDTSGVMSIDDGVSVLFSRDSRDLPAAAEPALTELAETLLADETKTLKLMGYSEPIGDAQSKPRRLSLFRALAVRTFLLKQGIDSRRMTVQALGAKDDGSGRPDNRVDLIVTQN